jgi:hypothetical protein
MHFNFAEQTRHLPPPQRPSGALRLTLTLVVSVLGLVALYQIAAFIQEYLRALGT